MHDLRFTKLAQVLVRYSTTVRPNDLVVIKGGTITEPLAIAVFEEVLRSGGHPQISLTPDECQELMLDAGSEAQLRYESPLSQFEAEHADVIIALWGTTNTRSLSRYSAEKQAWRSQARKKYLTTFLDRASRQELRWVGTQFPCLASAQDAEMSLRQYELFVLGAGLLDHPDPAAAWSQISERQQRLCDYLVEKEELHFVTPQGTNLRVGIQGRHWINCDGHENFPDGEVFTGPRETATQGVVRYSFPAVYGGREVDGIEFEFRDGRVVGATADKGEAFLIAMLDQDPGARVLGEIAIGTNYSIREYSKNTLFDEKIGGTFHAAVGSAYPESGGTNVSGLHWDMVCDLRKGGQIFADGELISENGRFLRAEWPQDELPAA